MIDEASADAALTRGPWFTRRRSPLKTGPTSFAASSSSIVCSAPADAEQGGFIIDTSGLVGITGR